MIVYYWPDHVWCYADELEEMNHKSDDYSTLEIPADVPEDVINETVQYHLKGNTNEVQ